jgi:hypothetical protein
VAPWLRDCDAAFSDATTENRVLALSGIVCVIDSQQLPPGHVFRLYCRCWTLPPAPLRRKVDRERSITSPRAPTLSSIPIVVLADGCLSFIPIVVLADGCGCVFVQTSGSRNWTGTRTVRGQTEHSVLVSRTSFVSHYGHSDILFGYGMLI